MPFMQFVSMVSVGQVMDLAHFSETLRWIMKNHQIIDPLGQPTATAVVIIVFAHVVRPSPLFKSSKTKQQKTMVAAGETVCLAEWIIDDTCLVNDYVYIRLHFPLSHFSLAGQFESSLQSSAENILWMIKNVALKYFFHDLTCTRFIYAVVHVLINFTKSWVWTWSWKMKEVWVIC